MLECCQKISPTYIGIGAYTIFAYVILSFTDSYLTAGFLTIVTITTGFSLSCLYEHFKSLPANKQTILVHSTKLVIISNYLPILKILLTTWVMTLFQENVEAWMTDNFFLACTILKWRFLRPILNFNWFRSI